MNRDFGNAHFSTIVVDDKNKGCVGLELYRTVKGQESRVARVLFWDASGQFSFESYNAELPLDIIEEVIAEARATIKIR